MVLSFPFWNDLKNAPICQWPEIVRKHKLTLQEVETVGQHIKNGWLYDCWLNALCIECFGAGITNAGKVFKKYGISDEEIVTVKGELAQRFYSDDRSWMYKLC